MKKCMTIFTIILICSITSDRKKWWVHMKVIIYRSKLTNSLIWTLHFCLPFTIKHSSNCNKSYAKRYDQKNRDIIYSHHSFDGKEKRKRDIKKRIKTLGKCSQPINYVQRNILTQNYILSFLSFFLYLLSLSFSLV